ncbi:MAG: response regulator transcription factor [Devosia sp.]|uniref:winged helix-turn-helix domain-containing protein n=1 Tax=Devosia sp. TaxID=1871048 RepID=UPI001AC79EFF|nr:response regulator transcription factor [Devosia sp.]MBN9317874.1 response regulator transcription factor [Devosia sp.]
MPLALIVEYGSTNSASLQSALEFADYETRVARDCDEARFELDRAKPDVVVVGRVIELPNLAEACAWMRGALPDDVPLLALGRQLGTGERAQALASGADDYLPPPVSGPVLVARVRENLRTINPASLGTIYSYGDVVIDDETRRVTRKSKPVHLAPTEYAIFRLLMASQGKIFSREEIVESVWGKAADVDVRNVDVHLKRIRAALRHPKGKGPIKSVRGLGYRI